MDPEAQILGTRNVETSFRTILSYIWNFEVLESRKHRKNEPQILRAGPQGGQELFWRFCFFVSQISLNKLPMLVRSSRGSKDWLNGAHFTISTGTENALNSTFWDILYWAMSVRCGIGWVLRASTDLREFKNGTSYGIRMSTWSLLATYMPSEALIFRKVN